MAAPVDLPVLPPLTGVRAASLPAWGDALVHRACVVCGADQPRPFVARPDGLVVSRCASCSHAYLAEVPPPEALARFYAQYAAEHKAYARPSLRERLALMLAARADVNVRLLEEYGGVRGRRILEVGASYGRFLERLQIRGASCAAIEVDEGARASLSTRGFEVLAEPPRDGSFDVAVALQVVEHLADPVALLSALHDSVRPGGRLLVAVPNAGEIASIGPYWVGFRVDLEHLDYYAASDLARLLARAGFYVENHWHSFQPHLFRPDEIEGRGGVARLLDRMSSRFFSAARLIHEGAYVLTALARRS